MRILAIRGENLASLKAPFEVDLTAEPLASAGLFAITGTTGAGKSTILDAMCLALYGESPRLADAGINDEVPDAGGEPIRSKDTRAILRRGGASGYAEVDFIAPDGNAYRARWSARRARGKADGRLQNVERALIRLADNQVLESQISAVNTRMAALTGLTFDEFRRTVLLAQGDFDAFLVAGTGERAALLEKVTGTRMYRDISRRVYERCGDAEQTLKALEDRRSGAMAMTDAARQEVSQARDALVTQIETLTRQIAAQTRDIETCEKIATARSRAAAEAAAEARARDAVAAATSDREKLARLDRALGLRTEHDRAARTREAAGALEAEEQTRAGQLETLAGQEKTTDVVFKQAEADFTEAEHVFKRLGPEWTKATDLDGQICTAANECALSEAALTEARETAARCQKSLDALVRDSDGHATARTTAETDLARLPQADRLAEAWDTVSGLIDERIGLTNEIATRQQIVTAQTRTAAQAQDARAALAKDDASDRSAIEALDAALTLARARLAEIAQADPGTRMTRLIQGASAVREMIRAATAFRGAQDARQKADRDRATAEDAGRIALAAAQDADRDATRAGAVLAALVAPLDRAEAAASEQAAHLRRHLATGEPCPVCGATEHPVSVDATLAGLARELRAQVEAERQAQTSASKAASEAQRRAESARLAAEAGRQAQEASDRLIATAEAEFHEARATAHEAGLETLPQQPASAQDALETLRSQIELRRTEIAALQAEEKTARDAADRDTAQIALHRAALETRGARRDALDKTRSDSLAAANLADQAAGTARTRRDVIDSQLGPLLAGVARTGDALDTDPEAERRALADIVAWYRRRGAERDAARDAVTELRPRISAAQADLKAALDRKDRDTATLLQRRTKLEALRQERAGLLGGEETEPHRTRHNAARLAAQTARDTALRSLSQIRSDRSGVAAALADVRGNLAKARAAQDTATRELTAKLAATGLTGAALDQLLAEGPSAADDLRRHLKTIDDALTSATAAAKARQDDLAQLLDAGLPDTAEETLRAARRTAEDARSAQQQQLGAYQGQLAADDALRLTLTALDAEIAAARQVCETWAAVNAAVGSAQGDKFARVAQTVTLAMLVERANQHLAELKPRYRLARGGSDLALHIVDRDMGDEVRSTRSLSGGERFLVSLALALALSRMGSHGGLAATLFIDEGFGALDAESLDVAIDSLEALQAQGRTIGVISHVDAMKDRIPVQVRVVRRGAGASEVELAGLG